MHEARTEILESLVDAGGSVTSEVLAAQLPLTAAELERHLTDLATDGLVARTDDAVTLTEPGRTEAWATVRRHRVTLLLLTELVGLAWSHAHQLAAAWEPLVDDTVQAHVLDRLDHPTRCPYGHPLDATTTAPVGVAMGDAPDGPVRVLSLNPRLVADREALEILERCGARPGDDIEIRSRRAGWLEVAGTIGDAALGPHITRNLTVAPFSPGLGRPTR
jgi:DtxR family transcriptional regulator, Mn-dependent transcriptional regulator